MKKDDYSKRVGSLFKTAILSYTCFVGVILVAIKVFSINVRIGYLVFLIVLGFFSIAMTFRPIWKSKTRNITDLQSNKEIVWEMFIVAISLPIACIFAEKVMRYLNF